jgi:hypothetical protein
MEPLHSHCMRVWLEESWSRAAPNTEYSLDIWNGITLRNRSDSMARERSFFLLVKYKHRTPPSPRHHHLPHCVCIRSITGRFQPAPSLLSPPSRAIQPRASPCLHLSSSLLYGNLTTRWGHDHVLLALQSNKGQSCSILFWLSNQTKNGAALFSLPNIEQSFHSEKLGCSRSVSPHSHSVTKQTYVEMKGKPFNSILFEFHCIGNNA